MDKSGSFEYFQRALGVPRVGPALRWQVRAGAQWPGEPHERGRLGSALVGLYFEKRRTLPSGWVGETGVDGGKAR